MTLTLDAPTAIMIAGWNPTHKPGSPGNPKHTILLALTWTICHHCRSQNMTLHILAPVIWLLLFIIEHKP